MPRVMFVDDEIGVLSGIRRNLRSVGAEWEFDFVTSAEHALQKMSVEPSDVVVTDIRMTAMQGDELVEALLTKYPATAPIVLSGYADPAVIDKLEAIGIRMLAKPCDVSTLMGAIRDAYDEAASRRGAQEISPSATIIDGAVQLEDYLMFLTEGLILAGYVDERTLPGPIQRRLGAYRDATAPVEEAIAPVPPVDMTEIVPMSDDIEWVKQSASGWVGTAYDKHRN